MKAIVPAIGRGSLVYDDEVTCFGIFILRSSKRGFFLRYRGPRAPFHDRRLAHLVGDRREEVKRLKREVDAGNDPLGRRIEQRNAPTMSDLIDR